MTQIVIVSQKSVNFLCTTIKNFTVLFVQKLQLHTTRRSFNVKAPEDSQTTGIFD
jgi:hypothetical protein